MNDRPTVKIISNGSRYGTQVLIDEKRIDGIVMSLEFKQDASVSSRPTCVLHIALDKFEYDGPIDIVGYALSEKGLVPLTDEPKPLVKEG